MVSAPAFQSLILSSIPGRKPVFLILLSACVSRPSISTYNYSCGSIPDGEGARREGSIPVMKPRLPPSASQPAPPGLCGLHNLGQ